MEKSSRMANSPLSIPQQFSTFNLTRMNTEKKSLWSVIIKVVIAVASAVAGALGISACNGL